MKILKYFTISISILFLSIILLIIGFILFFDLTKYKVDIEKLISEQLNRKVEIAGDLELSLYPLFSFNMENIKVYNSSIFEDELFIKISKINVSLDVIKLFKEKQLTVKNISLMQPEIHLITLDNGTNNWMDLVSKINGDTGDIEHKVGGNDKFQDTTFFVDDINIKDGVIKVKNNKNKHNMTLDKINITINNLGVQKTGKYKFSADLLFNENTCSFKADGTFNKTLETISLLNNNLIIRNIKIGGRKLENIYCSLSGNFNKKSGISNFNNIKVTYNTLKALSNIQISSKVGNNSISGNIQLDYIYNDKDFNFNGNISYKEQKVNLTNLTLNCGPFLKSSGMLEISLVSKPNIKYSIIVDTLNIDKLKSDSAKNKKSDNANNTINVINLLKYRDKLKNIKKPEFGLDGNLMMKEINFDNVSLKNITLHTTLTDIQFVNELKLLHKKTLYNTRLSIEKNKADEMIIKLEALANMLPLKEFFKNDLNGKFEILNKPSLILTLISNKKVLLLKNLDFTASNNDKPINIALSGYMKKNNGHLNINALEVLYNKSHINVIFNSNIKNILNELNGSLVGNIKLSDIAYFSDVPNANKFSEALDVKADFNINLIDAIFNFKSGSLMYNNSHLKWDLQGNLKKPRSLNLLVSADYINANEIMGLYSVTNMKKNNNEKIKINNKQSSTDDIKINLGLNIKKLLFEKLTMDDIKFTGSGENHKYKLYVKSIFYDGKLDGLLNINTEEISPSFEFNSKATNVAMNKLFIDLVNKPIFTGLGDLDIELLSSGNDINGLLSKLNGKIFVNIHKGTFNGLNIGFVLRNIFSLIEHGKFAINRTLQDYSGAVATINATNGVLYNNDLLIHSPFLKIRGNGFVNMLEDNIDYSMYLSLLKPAIDNTTKDEHNVIYTEMLNKELLIHYRGPIKNPVQDIDYRAFIEKTLGRELKKEIAPLKKKVDKFIEDLF